jgi:hypothetical protein
MNSRLHSNIFGFAKRRLLIILAGACVLLLVLIGLTALFKKSADTPQTVADSFVQYFVNGNAAKSYELYSIEAQKADTLQSWTTKVDKLKGFYSKETLKKTINTPPETVYVYQAIGKDGSYLFYVKTILDVKKTVKVSSFSASPGIYNEAIK